MTTRGALFDPIFGAEAIAEELSDAAWVAAILDVEVALTRAAARIGVVERRHVDAVASAAAELGEPGSLDLAELGRAAASGGNPVIPLVQALREQVARAGVPVAAVHPGATSQDVMDSALMLLAGRAGAVVLRDLRRAGDHAAELARVHRTTTMVARTLGQQAAPTTFGLLAAGWFTSLDAAASRLETVLTALPAQFGGAAGTLAASYPNGLVLAEAFADEVGLVRPRVPWHTERTVMGELAGALGLVAGAVSKPATDIVAMAGTELAEVAERSPGGSSSMPHKRNAVGAITARAAARRAPALVGTVLAAMDHELQRAAGAWHAEWEPLVDLLRSAGGAAHQLSTSLAGLTVDEHAMARNLEATGGLILAERVADALMTHTDRAREIVTAAAAAGFPLDRDPAITEYLTTEELAELLEPSSYLGHAPELVDRALVARALGGRR